MLFVGKTWDDEKTNESFANLKELRSKEWGKIAVKIFTCLTSQRKVDTKKSTLDIVRKLRYGPGANGASQASLL